MFCIRFFILVALLPFPTESPPLMLALWLFNFLLHQRPCLYCTILIIGYIASSCHRNIGGTEAEPLSHCWMPFDRAAWTEPFTVQAPLALHNATAAVSSRLHRLTSWVPEEIVVGKRGIGLRIWLGLSRPPPRPLAA